MPVSLIWPVSTGAFGIPGSIGRHISFLGKGLRSPLRADSVTGDFQLVSDEANVGQAIRDGVLTAIGERIMVEPFGTIARDMLFEQSDIVADLLKPSIRDHVITFEPRILLEDVVVALANTTAQWVEFGVSIRYVVRATNTRKNMVFPFYLTPKDQGQ